MRNWLLGLVPWMAIASGWAAPPGDVDVQFSYHPAVPGAGHRDGAKVYVNPDFLKSIGWTYSLGGETLTIGGEGRMMRLPTRLIEGRACVDLLEAARFVGGQAQWEADGKLLRITGAVRSIEATAEGVRIDSTVGVRATAFKLSDPPRLVVDVFGATVEPERLPPLPDGHRVSQFASTTVRYVVEAPGMATVALPKPAPGRTVLISLTEQERPEARAQSGAAPIRLTAGQAADEGAGKGRITFDFAGDAKQRPSAKYDGPNRILLTFPYAVAEPGLEVAGAAAVVRSIQVEQASADRVVVAVETVRPLAFTVRQQGKTAQLSLYAPLFGSLAGRLIVVDAGHGGKDSGAHAHGVQEKSAALDTAKRIAAELQKAGASVILTRDDDTFVDLNERPAVANRANADLFISSHYNSNTLANSRSGTIIFYHKDDPHGKLLAECVRAEVAKRSGLPDLGAWSDTRIYQSGFAVLRGAKMPGVLLELGFVNHATDRAKIADPAFRQAMAEAVTAAIKVYFSDGR